MKRPRRPPRPINVLDMAHDPIDLDPLPPKRHLTAGHGRAWRPKVTRAQRRRVIERDGAYCRHCLTTFDLTVDHIIPLDMGGEHHVRNMQILCDPCNMHKANGRDRRDIRR